MHELVFECPKDEINAVSHLIKKEMEQANLPLFPLNIPIVVDFVKQIIGLKHIKFLIDQS